MVSSMALKHRRLFTASSTFNESAACDVCDPTCPYGCYSYSDYYYTAPPPPIAATLSSNQDQHLSSYVVLVVVILSSFFLLVTCYVIIRKCCSGWNIFRRQQNQSDNRDEEFLDENRGPEMDHPIWYITTVGLQPSVINSITVFRYKKGENLIEGTTCSVCLSEFQDDETLRLLPKCNHAFHVDCIDTWLRSHTNCPVCRAGILSNTLNAPLGTNQQSSEIMNQNQVHQMELAEEDGGSDNSNDNLGGENRARTEDLKIPQDNDDMKNEVYSEMGEKSTGNPSFCLMDDSVDGNLAMWDEIQSARRSFSVDMLMAARIGLAFRGFQQMIEPKGSLFNERGDVHKCVDSNQNAGNSRILKMMGESSIAEYLHKKPVSMKRSSSYAGRASSLLRQYRNTNSIYPL